MSPRARRRQCGTMQSFEELAEETPSFRANQSQIHDFTVRSIETGEAQKLARRRITIPVVVHVVYKTAQENISKRQIQSQITALNKDFRAQNPDRANVPPVWQGLVADGKIEFKLATKDRTGRQRTESLAPRRRATPSPPTRIRSRSAPRAVLRAGRATAT